MSESKGKRNFVCANCLAVNRVPDDRLDDRPVCGKCKSELTSLNHPIELTDQNFSKFIERSDSIVIVDFWAPWCGPCRSMAADYSKAATALAPQIILAKLNTQEFQDIARPFNIAGIPCLIAFRKGKEIARQAGAMNVDQIVHWVHSIG